MCCTVLHYDEDMFRSQSPSLLPWRHHFKHRRPDLPEYPLPRLPRRLLRVRGRALPVRSSHSPFLAAPALLELLFRLPDGGPRCVRLVVLRCPVPLAAVPEACAISNWDYSERSLFRSSPCEMLQYALVGPILWGSACKRSTAWGVTRGVRRGGWTGRLWLPPAGIASRLRGLRRGRRPSSPHASLACVSPATKHSGGT